MKTRHQLLTTVGAFLISAFFLPAAHAQEAGKKPSINVEDLVKKASHAAYYNGKDGTAKVEMIIKDGQGRERVRKFTILRKDIDDKNDGAQKFYISFSYPSDVQKMSFLVWKNINKADDRWMYLPALDLVKPISASDERTSFVGSDFFYEDVSGRIPTEDKHTLLEESNQYYVLKSEPKDASKVEFSYYKNWIHKDTFIPVKTEFYNKANKLYRSYEASKVGKVGQYNTVLESKMTDHIKGGYTIIKYSAVAYDKALPESIFTERYLRTPPRQYMK